jgi:hypothetical protein
MMMSIAAVAETKSPNAFVENLAYWTTQLPATNIFKAWEVDGLKLLLTMGLLTRGVGVSLARIGSDYPDLNKAKQYDITVDPQTGQEVPIDPVISVTNKRRNFLERCCIEGVGTILASYVALQLCQDYSSKVLETFGEKIFKPDVLVQAAKKHLNPEQLGKFEGVLMEAFGRNSDFKGLDLKSAKHVIYSKVYGGGKLSNIAAKLQKIATEQKDPDLGNLLKIDKNGFITKDSTLGEDFKNYYKTLNIASVATVGFGAVFTAWLSGAPVQGFNDTWFRDKGMPFLLGVWNKIDPVDNAVKRTHKPTEPSEKPATTLNVVSTSVVQQPTCMADTATPTTIPFQPSVTELVMNPQRLAVSTPHPYQRMVTLGLGR